MSTRILILFLIAAITLSAQNPSEVIRKIQNKFNSFNNFVADFEQTYFSNNNSESGKVTGTFSYKKKNKFIVELKNRTITSDGSNIWNYDKKFNRVIISYANEDPTSFALEKFIFEYPKLCKAKILKNTINGANEEILELTPKDNDLQFQIVKIWRNEENLISKMELVDLAEMKYSFSFSKIEVNQDLSDSKFTFYPPKGTKVIDLR